MAKTLAEGRKPGSGRKPNLDKMFATTQSDQGMVSYDNTRENIDPAIRTKTVNLPISAASGAGYVMNDAQGWLAGGHVVPVAGSEVDPIFMALSGAFVRTETDPVFMTLSGAFVRTEVDPVWTAQSGSYLKTADEADPIWNAQSGAYLKTADLASSETDPLFDAASGAYNTDVASGAPHFIDSSDPHGATLTQTTINVTTGATTADNDASGAAVFRNVLIGTEAEPYDAGDCTQGTVYLQYTA